MSKLGKKRRKRFSSIEPRFIDMILRQNNGKREE